MLFFRSLKSVITQDRVDIELINVQPLEQSWIMPLIDKAVPVPDVGLIHQHQCFVTTPVQVNGLALQ